MKRLLFALCLLLPLTFVSCSDDDDLPNVNFDVTFDGAVQDGGTLYVVRGQAFEITGITVTNNEAGKGALISAANYYWDGFLLGTSMASPYGYIINIGNDVPLGTHDLTITCPLFAEDKTSSLAMMQFDVVVVESEDQLPDVATTPDLNHLRGTAKVTNN